MLPLQHHSFVAGMRWNSDAFSSLVLTSLAVVVSAAGAIVVGFSLMFIPLPLVAGFYLARFFTRKSLPSYFAFVVLGSLVLVCDA